MRRNLTTLLLLFVLLSMTAQNITFEGHVIDDEKNELIAATVRYFVDDSMLVKGVTTDSKGEFKFEVLQNERASKLVFSYIGYKELVINIQPTKESAVRLGDIVMKKDAVQIHEVTVLGENQVRTEDKLMVYPTKDELRHAYDGYSALDALMVPGLNVNTFNHSINYMNQTVLLCINGREATQDEVRDQNAKYIKRVDIYQMGKPEFPQAATVIDYIMKERDYAGTVAFNVNHHLTRPEGNGRLSTQYHQGKSEFAISLSGGYKNNEWKNDGHTITTYCFPNNTIEKTIKFLPSEDDGHNLNGYANYIFKDKTQNFYASLRLNHKEAEGDGWSNFQYNVAPTLFTKQENTASNSINPALKLQYGITLPNDQNLRLDVYGSYGDNDYNRWYEHRKDEILIDSYANSTDENSYYFQGKLNYTKILKNKSSINIDLNQDFTHTDNQNIRGENKYEVSLRKSNTRLNATYNYRIRNRFNIQARLAGHMSYVKTGSYNITNYFFTPSIRLSYIYKKHSFSLQGQASSIEASNSNRTGDEYRINEYEVMRGNPELKDYVRYYFVFDHTWNISKYFTWMTYATFEINTDYIYRTCEYDASRNSLIWKMQNSGTNWMQHYEAFAQWNILPQKLYIRTGLLYNYNKINIPETYYYDGLYFSGSIVYHNKGFRMRAGILTQPEHVNPQTGVKIKNPAQLNLSASYSINNWNISVNYVNPYSARSKGNLDLGIYKQNFTEHISRLYDNFGLVSVSYRFNYGKKKHKFDNTQVIDVNQTTISQ